MFNTLYPSIKKNAIPINNNAFPVYDDSIVVIANKTVSRIEKNV